MQEHQSNIRVVVVMGVAGVGKTTIGMGLAAQLGWAFFDADDYHPPENRRKMNSGQALTDEDRWGWLERLRTLIQDALREDRPMVLACSALRAVYRDILATDAGGRSTSGIAFVYLKASFDVVQARITARTDHYMPPSLLESQFATLEEPVGALVVDAAQSPTVLVDEIVRLIQA